MNGGNLWDALAGQWRSARIGRRAAAGSAALCAVGGGREGFPGATLLVVQDDPEMLPAITEAIDGLGLRVVGCRDAGEGLGAFALLAGAGVLLTDITARGVAGWAVVDAFRAVCANGVVIFTPEAGHGPGPGGRVGARDFVLTKPFSGDALQATVRRAAAAASTGHRPAN